MSTRDIRTAVNHTTCEVCGRTLLRGERPEPYIDGGERRWVCDLCTTRALDEGWLREGTLPSYDASGSSRERRRSLLGWLRPSRAERDHAVGAGVEPPIVQPPAPGALRRQWGALREPRHVRAVPASAEQKMAAAVDAFNRSEHARTIAGIARSLGSPTVSVHSSEVHPSIVSVVAAWELCWYRYEIDLAEDLLGVRLLAQGAELAELEEAERVANAEADENGLLALRR